MSYLLLIRESGERRRYRPAEEGRRAYERMVRFSEDHKARGLHKVSESLESDAEVVRVEVHDGERVVIDGPFVESQEIVGGFFLLDCESKEQAIAIASECPAAEWATVEVREAGPCYGE